MNIDLEKLGVDIRNSFSLLLDSYLPKELLNKDNLKIISVACGKFIDAECLISYFAKHKKKIRLYGIEIDESLINNAKERLLKDEKKDCIFLKQADATALENYEEWLLDGVFDLVIVRHPEITFNTQVFMKIFSLCAAILDKDRFMLVTTHHESERKATKLLFEMLKVNVLIDIENEKAVSIDKGSEKAFADKFLLIAKV